MEIQLLLLRRLIPTRPTAASAAKQVPKREDVVHLAMAFMARDGEARNTREILRTMVEALEKGEWKQSMEEEMLQLKEMGVYELVELPAGCNIVGCR